MIKNNDKLFKNSLGSQAEDDSLFEDLFFLKEEELIDPKLVAELVENGVKFNNSDLLFVTKDQSGQIVFLEKGNKKVGLEHILYGDGTSEHPGHKPDFIKNFQIEENKIKKVIYNFITKGEIVGKRPSLTGFDYVFKLKGKYLMITIADNGFIVTSHPINKDKLKEYNK